MRPGLALMAVVLLGAPLASAEIYRWTDEQGRMHFTQSLDQVPPRYRAAAQAGASAAPKRQIQRISSQPAAGTAAPARRPLGRTLRIPFERQGSLMLVQVMLNDTLSVPFYVDTGASGISLPQAVADRLGIGAAPGGRNVYVRTANGVTVRSLVTLDSVQLGGARVENLEATLNPSMEIGLLGGSFFNNFIYRVDAAEGVITLEPNENIRGGLGAAEWRQLFREAREPLERLDAYLDTTEIQRAGRRQELEGRRVELQARLDALEQQANRLGVPAAWRE